MYRYLGGAQFTLILEECTVNISWRSALCSISCLGGAHCIHILEELTVFISWRSTLCTYLGGAQCMHILEESTVYVCASKYFTAEVSS